MRPNWHHTFMKVAILFSHHSTCKRNHVGAVLVKNRRIISCGYNGSAPGMPHCEDVFSISEYSTEFRMNHHDFSNRYELHAEQNCIAFAARSGITITPDCVLYVTTAPCPMCTKLIVAAGICNVIYWKLYEKSNDGIILLKQLGVNITPLLEIKPNI